MKKDNKWNRIFHRKEITKNRNLYHKYKIMDGFYNEIYHSILKSKSLIDLLDIHKMAWRLGFQNENLGPCRWGMFRTENIEKMTVDEVMLGNHWGLWTNPIRYWESHKDDTMGPNAFGIPEDKKIYDLVLDQYKELLRSNIVSLEAQLTIFIRKYELKNPPTDPFKLK